MKYEKKVYSAPQHREIYVTPQLNSYGWVVQLTGSAPPPNYVIGNKSTPPVIQGPAIPGIRATNVLDSQQGTNPLGVSGTPPGGGGLPVGGGTPIGGAPASGTPDAGLPGGGGTTPDLSNPVGGGNPGGGGTTPVGGGTTPVGGGTTPVGGAPPLDLSNPVG